MAAHKATRNPDGTYQYRGFTLYKNDTTPAGYYGHWRVEFSTRIASDKLRNLKATIDERIDGRQ